MFDEAGQNPPTNEMSWEETIAVSADIAGRLNQGEERSRWGHLHHELCLELLPAALRRHVGILTAMS